MQFYESEHTIVVEVNHRTKEIVWAAALCSLGLLPFAFSEPQDFLPKWLPFITLQVSESGGMKIAFENG